MQKDENLWAGISRGDEQAFEQLYGTHFRRVREFLRVYLGNAAVVDDLAQDTFLQFWLRPQAFDPSRSTVRAYLFGIARKKAADWWRNHPREEETVAGTASQNGDSTLLLKDALEQLDPDSRNLLWLREVEGYSYEELGRLFEIPLGTVKSRLFVAREQLRKVWKACR